MTNEMAAKGIMAGAQIFAGAMILLGANATPPNMLFGVRLPAGFRSSSEVSRIVAGFRTIVAVPCVLGLVAILLASPAQFRLVLFLAPVSTVVAAITGYVVQHRRLKAFAAPRSQTREIELLIEPERLPWFLWLWPGPFPVLTAAAVYLKRNWDQIPARFPIHWGIDGQPNRWTVRSFGAVYGPLIFGAEVTLWVTILALAAWFGARRSPLRPAISGVLIAVAYSFSLVMTAVALSPLVRINPLITIFASLAILVPAVIHLVRKFGEPRDQPDPTPDECWKGGMLYYNPNDAALMVERRDGAGITVNFGNRWSWAIVSLLAVNVATVLLFR
jgi:uncharacterized membrane protein